MLSEYQTQDNNCPKYCPVLVGHARLAGPTEHLFFCLQACAVFGDSLTVQTSSLIL